MLGNSPWNPAVSLLTTEERPQYYFCLFLCFWQYDIQTRLVVRGTDAGTGLSLRMSYSDTHQEF